MSRFSREAREVGETIRGGVLVSEIEGHQLEAPFGREDESRILDGEFGFATTENNLVKVPIWHRKEQGAEPTFDGIVVLVPDDSIPKQMRDDESDLLVQGHIKARACKEKDFTPEAWDNYYKEYITAGKWRRAAAGVTGAVVTGLAIGAGFAIKAKSKKQG